MLNPCNVLLPRSAFSGPMILIGVQDAFLYENGKRTDVVTAVRCNVVLPEYGYERLSVKLPVGTAVNRKLVGSPVEFTDFSAKVYNLHGKIGYTATATGVNATAT